MKKIIAVVVCIVCAAGVANAAQIASPAIFGSHTQNIAECTVINGGSEAITLTVKILNESGGIEKSSSATLAPGQFFSIAKAISFGVAYACTVSASTSLAQVRAALSIEDPVADDFGGISERAIRSAPLR